MLAAIVSNETGTMDSPSKHLLWPELERTMDVFETHTVRELLFGGWDLPTFNFNFSASGIGALEDINYAGTLAEIMKQLGFTDDQIPEILKENKIGYFSAVSHIGLAHLIGKGSMKKT